MDTQAEVYAVWVCHAVLAVVVLDGVWEESPDAWDPFYREVQGWADGIVLKAAGSEPSPRTAATPASDESLTELGVLWDVLDPA